MRLFIIIPMFGVAEEELQQRRAKWTEWYGASDTQDPLAETSARGRLKKRYNLSDADALPLLPAHDIAMRPDELDSVIIRMPQGAEARLEKGLAVRLALIAALDQTDRRGGGAAARRDAKCILIDGSGAFDFESIFEIMDLLTGKSPEIDCPADVVLGTRPDGQSGMTVERKAIEDFEQFIVANAVPKSMQVLGNLPWPDGQAGCWGLSLSALTVMPLSALSYELELDLLTSSVASGLSIRYTSPLRMLPRRQTSVPPNPVPMSLGKLDFLQAKLGLNSDQIARFWVEFAVRFPETAKLTPQEYRDRLSNRASQMVRPSH